MDLIKKLKKEFIHYPTIENKLVKIEINGVIN